MRVLKNAIQNCSQNFIGTEVSGTGVCVNYDIETILGRFGPWEVPHAAK